MTIINIENVSKSFKGNLLFENVNAKFDKGKIYGIVGPNGSGKSILFKMICGFIRPDRGEIVISPEYRYKQTDFPKDFGIIIDRPGYLAGKTGFENLKRLADIQGQISEQEIEDAMKEVGLDPQASQKVKNYSLGMKQKLSLVQAFMENQSVLILDEPFNALDLDSVKTVRQMILDFKKEGKTIIMTSHNEEDIKLLCDHVYQFRQNTLEKIL